MLQYYYRFVTFYKFRLTKDNFMIYLSYNIKKRAEALFIQCFCLGDSFAGRISIFFALICKPYLHIANTQHTNPTASTIQSTINRIKTPVVICIPDLLSCLMAYLFSTIYLATMLSNMPYTIMSKIRGLSKHYLDIIKVVLIVQVLYHYLSKNV